MIENPIMLEMLSKDREHEIQRALRTQKLAQEGRRSKRNRPAISWPRLRISLGGRRIAYRESDPCVTC
ncbi:MAG: hypothetical protein KatS3mg057_2283 [Herpetosiphonaceae bacterium]|nr:MAG: hypothetical protein KatS3mg057_2283 [Herpetosiphonaceae bacterium]